MASRTVKVVFKAEGIKAITRQVENLNSALKGNSVSSRKAAKSTDNLDRVQRKAAKSAQELSFITKRLTASYLAGNIGARAISAAVSTLARTFASGLGAAVDFQFTMTKISAISSVTGANLASLENTIRDIAKVSPKTSTEVAAAALEMSKMGLAGKDLENSLQGVVGLSVALDEEVSTVGQTMVSVKNVFQKDATELTEVADKMFTTLGSSALNLEKFRTAFSFAGASARLAGVSFEEVSALMGVLADNGIKASTIGTQLRQVFTKLDDGSSRVSKAIGAQSIKTKGLKGTLQALIPVINDSGDAKRFFGQRAISVIDILTKNVEKFDELKSSIEGVTKKVGPASDALSKTMGGAIKQVSSAFEDVNIELSKLYSPFVVKGLTIVANLLRGITSGQNSAATSIQQRLNGVTGNVRGSSDFVEKKVKGTNVEALNEQQMIRKANAEALRKEIELTKLLADEAKKVKALELKRSEENVKLAEKAKKIADKKIQDELDGLSKTFKQGMVLHNAKITFIRAEEKAREDAEKRFNSQSKQLSSFVSGGLNGESSEQEALTSKYEEILALDMLSNDQRLVAYKSYLEQKEELSKKSALEERNQIISNGLAINSALGGLVGSLGNLASVRTSNAVKAAEAEGKSEEQINAIRRKGFSEQKKYLVLQAIMNTAAGITKAYVDPGGPMGLVLAGIVGLSGAAQVAAISSQKFAKGFDGTVSQPTLIEVGEEGPEDVMVKPRAKSGLKSNSDKPMIQVIVQGDINGEEDFLRRVRSANEELDRRTV